MYFSNPLLLAAQSVTDVRIDWFDQLSKGGVVVIIQAFLLIGLIAIVLERFYMLRAGRFVPDALLSDIRTRGSQADWAGVLAACKAAPCTLSDAVTFAIHHVQAGPSAVAQGINDIAQREMDKEQNKLTSLTLIAATAPLLGLLGTMIGMIESFHLVSLFGDEGGASILADSIGKALITTAVGLIIALPALYAHHLLRNRLDVVARKLDLALDSIYWKWFGGRARAEEPPQSAFGDENPDERIVARVSTT